MVMTKDELNAPAAREHRVLADRFEVLERIGEGSVGEVFRARDLQSGDDVAVKVLRPELTTGRSGERFLNEIRVFHTIRHPNVARCYGFGKTHERQLFLAMELVDGPSLGELAEGNRFPVLGALRIARQITRALAAAHELGVVHRDLKPDNVLLARDQNRGHVVKLVDFGLAKLPEGLRPRNLPALTGVHTRIGTPGYMAPEQTLARAVDKSADLYSLGVILYELLTGHPPFMAETKQAVFMEHRLTAPPAFAVMIPGCEIDVAVERLVMDLLAKEPDQRPSSAKVIIERLDALIESLSVEDDLATLVTATPRPERLSSDDEPLAVDRASGRRKLVGLALVLLTAAILTWVITSI